MKLMVYFMIFCVVVMAEMPGVAVLNFETKGDIPAEMGAALAETVHCKFQPKEFRLVERAQLKKILGERLANAGTALSAEEMAELTKAGVEFAMLGFVEKREGMYYGGWRLVEIKTGEICKDKKYIQGIKTYNEFVEILGRSLESLSKNESYQNLVEVAEEIAGNLGEKIRQMKRSDKPYRIAIFPFGNKEGSAGAAMGNLPTVLQAEIIRQLRFYLNWQAAGRFSVLEVEQIKDAFRRHGIDPSGISSQEAEKSRKLLQKAGIAIAILGRYEILDPSLVLQESLVVHAIGITVPENLLWSLRLDASQKALQDYVGKKQSAPCGRFRMRIFVKTKADMQDTEEKAWEERPLYRFRQKSSAFYNSYCLLLQDQDEGRRYKIVISNQGTPAVLGYLHPLDEDRLFAAALLIDGIDSFYHKGIPCVVHPEKASKWVLSSPKRMLLPDPKGTKRTLSEGKEELVTMIEGAKIVDVAGKGHSEVQILGFQKGSDKADSFVFCRPKEALAEEIGITESTGLISAYFYAERLPQISRGGTKKGPEIDSPTFSISFQTHDKPCEVISIFYRYESDLPCALEELEGQ